MNEGAPGRYVLTGPGIPPCISPATLPGLRALADHARKASRRRPGKFTVEAVHGRGNRMEVAAYEQGRLARSGGPDNGGHRE